MSENPEKKETTADLSLDKGTFQFLFNLVHSKSTNIALPLAPMAHDLQQKVIEAGREAGFVND